MVSLTKVVHAATTDSAISGILSKVMDNVVIPLVEFVFALAMVLFFWGIFQYFIKSDDGAKRAEGAQSILWGIVGMFIMVSVWGIIRFVLSSINVQSPI
jgi:hypothetical protein